MSKTLIIILAVVIGVARFLVPGSPLSWEATYEAVAHILVGLLLGTAFFHKNRATAWVAIGVLTTLETLKFLTK